MELAVLVDDVGQAPKVDDLARSKGAGHDEKLARDLDACSDDEASLLAPTTRRVAPATVEPESHMTRSPNWCTSYRGVETMASIVVRGGVRVCVSCGSCGLKNTRIT